MGLLDGVLGGVVGNVLNSAMGGQQDPKTAIVQGVLGMLLNQGSNNATGSAGGLGGLVDALSKGGLAEQVSSWVGTGQNLPVSSDQLSQVLGSLGGDNNGLGDILGQLAGQTGLNRDDVAGQLTELLPSIVDKLTPNGQLPDADSLGGLGDIGNMMQSILGK